MIELVILGYIGGLLAMLGWGIEGAVAGKGLDVVDPDVGISVRYIAEAIYWFIFVVPISIVVGLIDPGVYSYILTHLDSMWWFVLTGFCVALYYVCWYKSFPLVGVGRGLSLAMPYVVIAFILGIVFFGQLPTWNFIVGSGLALFGVFYMYTEKRDMIEVLRSTKGD